VETDHREEARARRRGRVDKSQREKTSARGVRQCSKVPRRNIFVVVMTTEVLKYDSAENRREKDTLLQGKARTLTL
jgi:hypothetical protein